MSKPEDKETIDKEALKEYLESIYCFDSGSADAMVEKIAEHFEIELSCLP